MNETTPNPADGDAANLDQSVDRLLEEVDALTEDVLQQASPTEAQVPDVDPASQTVADDVNLSDETPLLQDGDRTEIAEVVANVELELDRAQEQLGQMVGAEPEPAPDPDPTARTADPETISDQPPQSQLNTAEGQAAGLPDGIDGLIAASPNADATDNAPDAAEELDALLAEASALADHVAPEPPADQSGATEDVTAPLDDDTKSLLREMEALVADVNLEPETTLSEGDNEAPAPADPTASDAAAGQPAATVDVPIPAVDTEAQLNEMEDTVANVDLGSANAEPPQSDEQTPQSQDESTPADSTPEVEASGTGSTESVPSAQSADDEGTDSELLAEMEQLVADAGAISSDVLEASSGLADADSDSQVASQPPLSPPPTADALVEQVDSELDRLGELLDDMEGEPAPEAEIASVAPKATTKPPEVDAASEIAATPTSVDVSGSSATEKQLDYDLDEFLAPPPGETEDAGETTDQEEPAATTLPPAEQSEPTTDDLGQYDGVPIWGILRMRVRRRVEAWLQFALKFSYDKLVDGLSLVDRPFAKMPHKTKELIGYCALGTLGMSIVAVFVAFIL